MWSSSCASSPSLCSLLLPSAPSTLKQSRSVFNFSPRPDSMEEKSSSRPIRCSSQLSLDLAPAAAAAYGALRLGGGLFAYTRSGSKGSIIGGLSGAGLMAATYYLMQSPETKEVGVAIGFGSAFLFSSVFGIRLAATRKLVPSGLLLALSLGALAVFLSANMQDKL